MTSEEIIKDITSGDTHKVWSSSCEIISIGQSREKISPLINHLPLIKEKTNGLSMGGGFAPNRRFVDYAIRIIEFHKNNSGCTCELYADKYECNDPEKEADKKNVVIENVTMIDGSWIDYYILRCTRCGQRFKTSEGQGHYTWWQWTTLS